MGTAGVGPRDRFYLDRALRLGRRGWGRVHPNPMVGCVVVRGDEVVAEGWHAEYGGDHAEVAALRGAGDEARGSEVFVSLEPCRHEGKTPPCTRALRAAGVRRVVYGAADPGGDSGGGAEELRAAGIEVVGPVLGHDEASWENPAFFHRWGAARAERPWVALKLACSLDGRIARRPGERTRLTGPEGQDEVQVLRAGFDALMVGARTALVDDPRLTVRGRVRPRTPPKRVVLDPDATLPPTARLLAPPEEPECAGESWVVTTPDPPASWRASLEARGARVLQVPGEPSEGEAIGGDGPSGSTDALLAGHPEGRLALDATLHTLRELGVESVLCEGGGVLGSALLAGGWVDRLYLVLSPIFLGEHGVPAFPGVAGMLGSGSGPDPAPFRWTLGEEPRQLGDDLWLALRPPTTGAAGAGGNRAAQGTGADPSGEE